MEFRFSTEEEDLRRAVSDFVRREIAEKELNTLDHIPADVVHQMGELGFFSLKLPEKHGGQQAGWVDLGILVEEVAKESIGLAHLTMVAYEAGLLLATYGDHETIDEWMGDISKGSRLGCVSVTEHDSGSDMTTTIKTMGRRDGDSYIISGEKVPVSLGMKADYTILLARTTTEAVGDGMTGFLVPLHLPGITKVSIPSMGLVSSTPAHIVFDKVRIPARYRIGREGGGLEIARKFGPFSDLARLLSALICLGAASSALKIAVAYSKERFAFGRPIGQFEAVSGKIAEHATLLEAARWLCYRGLWMKDQGLSSEKEAAMCGWWCPNLAFRIMEDALLVHGHLGYTDEFPIEQMLRDVVGFELIAGTPEILKLLIAEESIGDMAVPAEMRGGVA
jgi:cyclohexanecarboxyl-CoA dehydrogenase